MGLRTALAENYTQQFATKVVNAIVMHPIRSNKALRAKVGGRAVEYVQRLHKNLGHCGANVSMVITIVIGILTMGWVIYNFGPEIFKGKNEKNDSMEQEPMPELDPLDYGEDSDVTGNIVNDLWAKNEKLKIQVKELESKVSFLMGIIQKTEKKENAVSMFAGMPEEVFTTPTGLCFRTGVDCCHIHGKRTRWRLCKTCGH